VVLGRILSITSMNLIQQALQSELINRTQARLLNLSCKCAHVAGHCLYVGPVSRHDNR
jgi:hypothetical protein